MSALYDLYTEGRLVKALSAGAGAAGVLSIRNDSGQDLIIEDLVLRITGTVSGQTVDAGVAATAISNDSLIDGGSIASAARLSNHLNPGVNGKTRAYWPNGHFLTVTASGTPTGLVGTADIYAKPVS
jgi:hypothetical protein